MSILLFRRGTVSLLMLLGGMISAAAAPAAPLPEALVAQAHLSPRAAEGLFVAVTRAGGRLVAVGEQGRIMLSDDNGKSWRQSVAPTSVTLTGVAFATAKDGWAIGQMGVILRTQDGGESWIRIFDGVQANDLMLKSAQSDQISKPDNEAAKANLEAAQQFISGGVTVPFLAIKPLSDETIVAAGGFGMAFESSDGGRVWRAIFDSIPNPNGFNIYDVVEDRDDIYFIGEQGFVVRRSLDGVYTTLSTPFTGTFFGGVSTKSGVLILYGLQGTILCSEDSGKSWTSIQTDQGTGIDASAILEDGTIVLGDTAGNLLVSRDNGKSFSVAMQAGEPVVGLVQAQSGDLVIAGPRGLKIINPARLHAGV